MLGESGCVIHPTPGRNRWVETTGVTVLLPEYVVPPTINTLASGKITALRWVRDPPGIGPIEVHAAPAVVARQNSAVSVAWKNVPTLRRPPNRATTSDIPPSVEKKTVAPYSR